MFRVVGACVIVVSGSEPTEGEPVLVGKTAVVAADEPYLANAVALVVGSVLVARSSVSDCREWHGPVLCERDWLRVDYCYHSSLRAPLDMLGTGWRSVGSL